ncbi:hypothetical protein F4813DRAFT_345992 [Daldinia decipiens]|uniref:uncharacterized protein n=1 Tax=Daldinia decipiens TaxID=326647 RepID=UPI0020C442B2|nr:uncharacterized protein F4813DRAFT_345992 [Daldinia decipiens]KAI1661853.1 hypothetical protein F4813DRAFT_345992 [Daldinia decipiens]
MASFYELTIPVLTRALRTEVTLLKKAEEYAKSTGTSVEKLVAARLAPDMFSLSKQVGVTVHFARVASHLLAGRELVLTQLDEWSLEENYSAIADTLKLLAGIKPEDVDGKESDVLSFNVGPGKDTSAKAVDYVTKFLMPSVYFHFITLYDILRHEGVPLGKLDFLGHQIAEWELV